MEILAIILGENDMNKVFIMPFIAITCLSATACNSNDKPEFEITTKFEFAKDGDKKEFYDTNIFEINTKIYVCVDFSITKNIETSETISFIVQIP